ncbi:hypothetical protein GCM10027347_46320 [Larkinella harenae]
MSHLSPKVTETDLIELLTRSRQNNQQTGISGVLLAVGGSILQVLEGPQAVVETLYERIRRDARHSNVSTVLQRSIQQRQFSNMAMGYQTLTLQQLDQIQALVDLDQPEGLDRRSQEALLLRTVRLFYQSNR